MLSARSHGSFIPTSRRHPTRRSASARLPRPTRSSPTRSGARPTTATGAKASAGEDSRLPISTSAISRTSSEPSSASRSSVRPPGPGGPSRGGDVVGECGDLACRGVHRDLRQRRRPASRRSCETCGGDGAAPGTSPVTCEMCGGAGRVQQVSQSVFGQFVRTGTCPRCEGTRPHGRVALPDL